MCGLLLYNASMIYYVKLYMRMVAKEVARYFTYRTNLFSGALFAVISLAMRYALWQALYRTGNADGATFAETMTFFIVSGTLFQSFGVSVSDIVGPDIRTGDLANRLNKPYPYQFYVFSLMESFNLTRLLTVGTVNLVVGYLAIGIAAPASLAALPAFLVSAVLGNFLFLLIDLCISYSAFLFTDYWFVSWFTQALMQLFGGVTLPLWFYPDALYRVSQALPFRFVVFEPMQIYLGRGSGSPWLVVLAQCAWILALLTLERLIWRRCLRRVAVQGG